jgi:hypothetical protein
MPLMTCIECGHQISVAADVCPSCGHPVPPNRFVSNAAAQPRSSNQTNSGSGIGLWAMLCGIGGLVMIFLPFIWLVAGLPDVFGIVLGTVGLKRAGRGESGGWGMSLAGLITGFIGLLLYAFMWLWWQYAVNQAFGSGQ